MHSKFLQLRKNA